MSFHEPRVEEAFNRLSCSIALEPAGSAVLRQDLLHVLEALTSLGPEGQKWVTMALVVLASPTLAGLREFVGEAVGETAVPGASNVSGAPAPVTAIAPAPPTPPAAFEHPEVVDDLTGLQADPDLSAMFFMEALDHLSTIETTLLQLESSPGDGKLLNDVFRPFHTIKGNAGALGLARMQQLAHVVESLLDLARSGRYDMGPAEFDHILQAVDVLSALARDTQARMAGGDGEDLEPRRRQLVSTFDGLVRGGPSAAPAPPAPHEPMTPPAATLEPSSPTAAPQLDVMPEVVTAPVPEPVTSSAVTASAPSATDAPLTATSARAAVENFNASVKVDTRKLDNLVDMVGELVIVQSIIQSHPDMAAFADESLGRHMAQLKRISSDLQRNAMAMRMVPIRQTFQKMARLVRDLSRKSGKVVDLTLIGEDTELDRRVVEDITDPLMHMVRNSVDHGLEMPDGRAARGKPAVGKLTLSAYHQGGNIVIAIIDDGKGLDVERIRAKAVANGLIEESDQPTPAELHQMIFRPGFSTAEKITEVSGRGVGMDVVRRNIEALRGWIEIQTEAGQGTTFLIKLPLTLAIVDGLVLRIGRERFVLPTFAIRESLRPAREQVHSVQGQAMVVQVRDRLVPILPLGERFGIADYRPEPWEGAVIIVEDDGRQVGLLVDELLGKQEVVIKSLGPLFAGVPGVSGGAILGDGKVGLILDVHAVVGLTPAELARTAQEAA